MQSGQPMIKSREMLGWDVRAEGARGLRGEWDVECRVMSSCRIIEALHRLYHGIMLADIDIHVGRSCTVSRRTDRSLYWYCDRSLEFRRVRACSTARLPSTGPGASDR